MSRSWKPAKPTVELDEPARVSRIRRDPALADNRHNLGRDAWWETRQWEIRLAVIGIILFALGVNAVVFDLTQVFND